jgi:hypothetical protein
MAFGSFSAAGMKGGEMPSLPMASIEVHARMVDEGEMYEEGCWAQRPRKNKACAHSVPIAPNVK